MGGGHSKILVSGQGPHFSAEEDAGSRMEVGCRRVQGVRDWDVGDGVRSQSVFGWRRGL